MYKRLFRMFRTLPSLRRHVAHYPLSLLPFFGFSALPEEQKGRGQQEGRGIQMSGRPG